MTVANEFLARLETIAVSELIAELGLELFAAYVTQCAKATNATTEQAITLVALTYAQNKAG